MSAAAAFSGSLAALCLGTAITSGSPGPVCGFLAGLAAAVALVRAVRDAPTEGALRICPGGALLPVEAEELMGCGAAVRRGICRIVPN